MARQRLIEIREGTAAEWAAVNPVLEPGEPGWDSTNQILKVGDGATAWASLPPAGGSGGFAPAGLATPLSPGKYFTPPGITSSTIPTEGQFLCGAPMVAGRSCSVSRIAASCTVAGSAGAVVRFGIYGFDLVNDIPTTLIVDAGAVPADVGPGALVVPGLAVPIALGQAFVAGAVVQGGAGTRPTLRSLSGTAQPMVGDPSAGLVLDNNLIGWQFAGAAGALPAAPAWTVAGGIIKVAVRADA